MFRKLRLDWYKSNLAVKAFERIKVSRVSVIYVPLISQWKILISKRALPPHFCQTMFSLLKKMHLQFLSPPFQDRQKVKNWGGGTIPILHQHIFGLFFDPPNHPPYVSINSTERQQNWHFLTSTTQFSCWRNIGMVVYEFFQYLERKCM